MEEFDVSQWIPVVGVLLTPSIIMIAVSLLLSGFAPEMAERAKQHIPTVFLGLILLSVAGALATAFITAAGGDAAAAQQAIAALETVTSMIG